MTRSLGLSLSESITFEMPLTLWIRDPSLWRYRNGKEHQDRLAKWQLEHGNCDDAPLFLNRSGQLSVTGSGRGIHKKSLSRHAHKFICTTTTPPCQMNSSEKMNTSACSDSSTRGTFLPKNSRNIQMERLYF